MIEQTVLNLNQGEIDLLLQLLTDNADISKRKIKNGTN
jgi:hypothetical protein